MVVCYGVKWSGESNWSCNTVWQCPVIVVIQLMLELTISILHFILSCVKCGLDSSEFEYTSVEVVIFHVHHRFHTTVVALNLE